MLTALIKTMSLTAKGSLKPKSSHLQALLAPALSWLHPQEARPTPSFGLPQLRLCLPQLWWPSSAVEHGRLLQGPSLQQWPPLGWGHAAPAVLRPTLAGYMHHASS